MKWIFAILIITYSVTASAQNLKDTAELITVTKGLKAPSRNNEVKAFADSINNYITGNPPPRFLLDECFELDNLLWKSFHPTNSVRWEILSHVYNKKALQGLMQAYPDKLKKKCSYERIHAYKISIPTADQSFYQLINMRYQQLLHLNLYK
jgi:hypothetical protein